MSGIIPSTSREAKRLLKKSRFRTVPDSAHILLLAGCVDTPYGPTRISRKFPQVPSGNRRPRPECAIPTCEPPVLLTFSFEPHSLNRYLVEPQALKQAGNCVAGVLVGRLQNAILQCRQLKLSFAFLPHFRLQIGIGRREKTCVTRVHAGLRIINARAEDFGGRQADR